MKLLSSFKKNSRDSRDPELPLGIPGNISISVKLRREFTGV